MKKLWGRIVRWIKKLFIKEKQKQVQQRSRRRPEQKWRLADMSKITGTVKFFNQEKGFGFIRVPGGDDLFVHVSDVVGDELNDNDEVQFSMGQNKKGPAAVDVVLTQKADQGNQRRSRDENRGNRARY